LPAKRALPIQLQPTQRQLPATAHQQPNLRLQYQADAKTTTEPKPKPSFEGFCTLTPVPGEPGRRIAAIT